MNDKQHTQISKFLSRVLRHQPAAIGITLDESGWTDVNELIKKAQSAGVPLHLNLLIDIVQTNNKKRFSFNESFDKIRANQGHSVTIELGYKEQEPPETLYHGTSDRSLQSILQSGIEKKNRHHVHLSMDTETAISVGKRHGKPVVLRVMARQMFLDKYKFYLSANGVWLTDHVPQKYLQPVS